ncbi:hypothetical protein GH733_007820 [Mirounga leonina]|nr:hypothetical protein GH733_007820 [Mirounga leonina]
MIQSRATGRAQEEELCELLKPYGKGHTLQKFMDGELEIPVPAGLILRLQQVIETAAMATYKLVLIRQGKSTWDLEHCFSGWYDVT